MKKLKNRKGVTGIDVALSIMIILISFGIIINIYSTYSKRNKEVNRKTKATNIALRGMQTIENKTLAELKTILLSDTNTEMSVTNYNSGVVQNCAQEDTEAENLFIYELTDVGKSAFGMNDAPSGYKIYIKISNHSNNETVSQIAGRVFVKVDYNVNEDQIEDVEISTIKKLENFEQAVEPKIKIDEDKYTIPYGDLNIRVVPIRYDLYLENYVETNHKNSEWYSINSGRYATVAQYNGNDPKAIFSSANGAVKNDSVVAYYVWMPYICTYSGKYYFCTEDGMLIEYVSENNSSFYKKSEVSGNGQIGGYWVKIKDKDLKAREPDDGDSNKNNYKTLITHIINNYKSLS